MPTLFQMPFLARLTTDHTLEGPQDTRKRTYNEPGRTFEDRERQHKAKKRRLGSQLLSSRPKIFANGLLSPVRSLAASPTTTHSPTGPGSTAPPTKAANADTNDIVLQHNARTPYIPNGTNVRKEKAKIATSTSQTKEEKRSLRSKDGTSRSRSELAQYFPDYEELMRNGPPAPGPLTAKTRLLITEDPSKIPSTPSRTRQLILPPSSSTQQTPFKLTSGEANVIASTTPKTSPLTTFHRIDFSTQLASLPSNPAKDPLRPDMYRAVHARGERQEKQLRNIEKEKAQHEKVQLERLYEGLLGHDWLRVMGVSGITETEKKGWERRRDWVLREVKVLLDKFERYREAEKRLRAEKEVEMIEGSEDEDEDDLEDDSGVEEGQEETGAERKKRRRRYEGRERDHPRTSGAGQDLDALAARQLQSETLSSATTSRAGQSRRNTGIDVTPLVPIIPPAEEKPFTSFFAKPHLRAAAIAGHRRGRSRFAFGHAVPEVEEKDFSLPHSMLTTEARKASARMRRSLRRSGR